jgi:hypothetical protein
LELLLTWVRLINLVHNANYQLVIFQNIFEFIVF